MSERVILQIVLMLIKQVRTHMRLKKEEREGLLLAEENIRSINRRLEDTIINANDRIIKERRGR